MSYASFSPCPHCSTPLVFLDGASGSTMNPQCPRCHEVVSVQRATFLMADNSRPRVQAKPAATTAPAAGARAGDGTRRG